ncbi:MAG: hypothetical protein JWM59_1445 [Verrucomicrobiales bacterium]|nr:hypothetical protein [Verrucomicrobiales bacterium]
MVSPAVHAFMRIPGGNPMPLIFTSLRWWWRFRCVYDPFTWGMVAAFVPVPVTHCAAATSLK